MQDKLKQFVDDHREELEVYQPRGHLWERVSSRFQQGRIHVLWQRFGIAASVLLAVVFGTWTFYRCNQTSETETSVAAIPPIAKAEAYYTAVTQFMDVELEQYCMPQPELCKEFERDLEGLNDAYRQLKKEYIVAADKKPILQAIASNLQMQVQLISQQLQIMEAVTEKEEAVKIM